MIKRGEKLESKGKNEKAIKLYSSAYKKLLEANKIESRNPDILNYLGFTSRKQKKREDTEKKRNKRKGNPVKKLSWNEYKKMNM